MDFRYAVVKVYVTERIDVIKRHSHVIAVWRTYAIEVTALLKNICAEMKGVLEKESIMCVRGRYKSVPRDHSLASRGFFFFFFFFFISTSHSHDRSLQSTDRSKAHIPFLLCLCVCPWFHGDVMFGHCLFLVSSSFGARERLSFVIMEFPSYLHLYYDISGYLRMLRINT